MTIKAAGLGPGERRLNGPQTTGREYRNLSAPSFAVRRTNNIAVPARDGTTLLADLFQPDAEGAVPALVSFSAYPRQIQDVGAPLGFIEAGASDFFVPRGYAHLIVNARGTGGSGGVYSLLDQQEREDLYDVVEWAAAQPWCDGNLGMLGVSYFAMAQLGAAAMKPPHLKAIAPLLATDDVYDAVWHHGLLNAGFFSAWLPAVGVLSQRPDSFWRSWRIDLVRDLLAIPAIHARMQNLNGEAIVTVLKDLIHAHCPERPFGELWRAAAIEHPTHDAFWDARNVRPLLESVEIPVYLGGDWDNVPMHLPSTFSAWAALRENPNVRMALLSPGGFSWPWESLHHEVLAWYDHWLKGRETGVMAGEPVRYQVPGAEGWRTAEQWPPPEAALTPFALRADGLLAREEGEPGFRDYLHLPAVSGVRARRSARTAGDAHLGEPGVRCGPRVRGRHRVDARSEDHGVRHVVDRGPLRRAAGRGAGSDHRRMSPRGLLGRRRDTERSRRAGPRLPFAARGPSRGAGLVPHSRGPQCEAHRRRSSPASGDCVRRRDQQDAERPRFHPRRGAGSKPEHDLQRFAALASPRGLAGPELTGQCSVREVRSWRVGFVAGRP